MEPPGYADATHVPPLVVRAVVLANELGFEYSCLPEQGRLLRVLAAGRSAGRIGETGTGCGVGLAWMVSGASPDTTLVSVERDEERAARATALFATIPTSRSSPATGPQSSNTARSTCSCSTAAARAKVATHPSIPTRR